jgi:UDP-glucose 4-epimerase
MSKALVTGGAGFIGSNLVDYLLEEDFDVRVLDNLSTGKISNISKQVELIKGDINDIKLVKTSMKDVQYVFHLAAQASVSVSMKNPLLDAQVNSLGTLNVLEQAKNSEVEQFIFSSTGGAIYGEPKHIPVNESGFEEPISIYGVSKLSAEKYIKFYQKMGLNCSILRFANVYGPRQDPFGEAGVLSIFLNNIKMGKPIYVYGDGSSSRDYVFVKDIARVAFEMVKKPHPFPINIGSGKETILNDLIQIIKDVLKKDFNVIYTKEREGDVKNIYLDCQNLQKHFGWIPSTSLEEGILELWNWINREN